jgi:hypothetical protein
MKSPLHGDYTWSIAKAEHASITRVLAGHSSNEMNIKMCSDPGASDDAFDQAFCSPKKPSTLMQFFVWLEAR